MYVQEPLNSVNSVSVPDKLVHSEFQKIAIKSIKDGHHTLITAHTGSGKTLPAEFAIEYFTSTSINKKVIYTSPIKALSNQKYNDFIKKFPTLDIGLLTGDNKHNPNANVLIMTTEILQNNLFKLKNNTNENENKLDFNIDIQNDLACVIFDEIHFIDDPERGTVWEHCIMLLPDHIQFIMLSATIGEKEKFAGWIEKIKNKKVTICGTNERVVPLTYYSFFTYHQTATEKMPITQKVLLESKINKLDIIKDNTYHESNISINKKCLNILKDIKINKKFVINEVCKVMRQKEMFPALFFVFSRKKVEEIANEITFPLFEENEKDYEIEKVCKQLIVSRVTNWKEYIILPEYTKYIQLLNKGIGIHHAGMLPIFREMFEILYEKRYIKVLVATETFAIGLNMPTKTVCFTSLYKYDTKLRLLHPHEFIQMSGRAGRRNIDTNGNVILLRNLYEPLELYDYYKLFNSEPKILKSKFKIGYELILHMNNNTNEEIKQFIEKSMMNEDITNDIIYHKQLIKELERDLIIQKKELVHEDVCESYLLLKDDLGIAKNKIRKKILNEILTIESIYKDLQFYLNIYNRVKTIEKELYDYNNYIYYCETYIEQKINSTNNILIENDYIKDDILTNKGNIAIFVHEIHPLIYTDLYIKYDGFSQLSSTDIFCLFSCFYPMKEGDIFPTFLKNELLFIKERINYYKDKELEYGLNSYNCELQYNMMEYIKEWMDNCDDETKSIQLLVKMKFTIFCGDFIKCCLKIVNICKEIEPTATYELKEKIIEGKTKLMKFICTNQSLYL